MLSEYSDEIWEKSIQMKPADRFLCGLFIGYLELVALTSRIVVKNRNLLKNNVLTGYWHGDSNSMQLVLRQIAEDNVRVKVIVTSDKRGDYIERILSCYGASAVRLPDGLKMLPFLQSLRNAVRKDKSIFAFAMDGPVGPLHEPKKLMFMLASESDRRAVYIHFKYSKVIRLTNRWDNYAIPLPFTRITAIVEDLGKIKPGDMKMFNEFKKKIKI